MCFIIVGRGAASLQVCPEDPSTCITLGLNSIKHTFLGPNFQIRPSGDEAGTLSSTAGESHGTQSENQWLNWVTWDPTQILPPTWLLKSLSRFSVIREQSPSTDWLFPVCLALCV